MITFLITPLVGLLSLITTVKGYNPQSSSTEIAVTLQTSTGDLHGTLALPGSTGAMPIVLIIAGSGPTDRNGNNPMAKNESLRKLAEALAAENIASLRYDKRGIGESKAAAVKESDLRFDHYVEDARDWIALLKKDARFSKIIVAGHSEGALIGIIATAKNADGLISIAGAGRPADVILREQLSAQPQGVRDTALPILDSLMAGKEVKKIHPMLYGLFRPSVQPYLRSWFRYDPAAEIKKLTVPILVVQGTRDIQVNTSDAALLSNGNAKTVIITDMNHIFRIVGPDRNENMSTYNDPSLPISTEMVREIVLFIQQYR